MAKLPVTDTVSIYHITRTGNQEDYNNVAAYSNVDASITPTGTLIQMSIDVPAFQSFDIYFHDVTMTLQNGDKMTNQDGISYILFDVPFVSNSRYLKFIYCSARRVV